MTHLLKQSASSFPIGSYHGHPYHNELLQKGREYTITMTTVRHQPLPVFDHVVGLTRPSGGGPPRIMAASCPRSPSWLTTMQLVRYVVLLFTMQGATRGQDPGPSYKTNRACMVDKECNTDMGEVCWWSFDGCPKGECMCHPKMSYQDASGRCRPLKFGNEECTAGDKCPSGMTCKYGRCLCTGDGIMTMDRRSCLKPEHKLLGDSCTPGIDTCYQRRTYHDYTANDMLCSRLTRTCKCRDGLKEDGIRCRRWNIGEAGCSKDHHCQGGALCLDGKCQCPSGYIQAAGDSKCVKIGAKYDLQIGDYCDEINELRYCARDLVCHRCAESREYTCVKYLPSQPESGEYVSQSPRLRVSVVTVVMTTIFTTVATFVSSMSSR